MSYGDPQERASALFSCEREGYGLYSYLLFGAMPAGETRKSYSEASKAHRRLIPHFVALEKYFKPRELKVRYLPIRKLLPDAQAVTPEQRPFQDFSTVPTPLISLWVKEFLNQAAQQDFSQEGTTVMLALRLRTAIARLAIALPKVEAALKRLGLPDIGTVLKTCITWHSPG